MLLQLSKALLFLSFYKVQNKHSGATFQAFFISSYQQRARENPSNWRVHRPLDIKKCKNQLSQNVSFWTMNENMIAHFFFFLTQVASIRNPPTSSFELI